MGLDPEIFVWWNQSGLEIGDWVEVWSWGFPRREAATWKGRGHIKLVWLAMDTECLDIDGPGGTFSAFPGLNDEIIKTVRTD